LNNFLIKLKIIILSHKEGPLPSGKGSGVWRGYEHGIG
jgi:hypothetical protein